MMHLCKYPKDIEVAILSWPAAKIRSLAFAARLSNEDVIQEIALAALRGVDPARAVPKAIGIRRLANGRWRAIDPIAAGAIEFDEVAEVAAVEEEEKSAYLNDADSIVEIMARARIGRRAAQIRIKKQLALMVAQGDFFARAGAA